MALNFEQAMECHDRINDLLMECLRQYQEISTALSGITKRSDMEAVATADWTLNGEEPKVGAAEADEDFTSLVSVNKFVTTPTLTVDPGAHPFCITADASNHKRSAIEVTMADSIAGKVVVNASTITIEDYIAGEVGADAVIDSFLAVTAPTAIDVEPSGINTSTSTGCLMKRLGRAMGEVNPEEAVDDPVVPSNVVCYMPIRYSTLGPCVSISSIIINELHGLGCLDIGHSRSCLDALHCMLDMGNQATKCLLGIALNFFNPRCGLDDALFLLEQSDSCGSWQPWPPPLSWEFSLDHASNHPLPWPNFVISSAILVVEFMNSVLLSEETSSQCLTNGLELLGSSRIRHGRGLWDPGISFYQGCILLGVLVEHKLVQMLAVCLVLDAILLWQHGLAMVFAVAGDYYLLGQSVVLLVVLHVAHWSGNLQYSGGQQANELVHDQANHHVIEFWTNSNDSLDTTCDSQFELVQRFKAAAQSVRCSAWQPWLDYPSIGTPCTLLGLCPACECHIQINSTGSGMDREHGRRLLQLDQALAFASSGLKFAAVQLVMTNQDFIRSTHGTPLRVSRESDGTYILVGNTGVMVMMIFLRLSCLLDDDTKSSTSTTCSKQFLENPRTLHIVISSLLLQLKWR